MAHSRTQSNEQTTFSALKRHDKYYLNGGDLYFLVENQHFRVHRYFFERESTFFQGELAVPASPGQEQIGTSQGNAIMLNNVRSKEFERFLWVFYNPKYSLYNTTVEEWTSILELAHRWKFAEVKDLVIRELEKLPITDIEKIVLYHKYEVDKKFLVPCYSALCRREAPLSLEEGTKLGLEMVLMIARARECARCKPTKGGPRSPTSADLDDQDMRSIVEDLFGIDVTTTPAAVNGTKGPTGGAKGSVNGSTNGSANGVNGSASGPNGPAGDANGSANSNTTATTSGTGSPTGGSREHQVLRPRLEMLPWSTLLKSWTLQQAPTPSIILGSAPTDRPETIAPPQATVEEPEGEGEATKGEDNEREGNRGDLKTDDVNVNNDVGNFGLIHLDADKRTAEEVAGSTGKPEAEGKTDSEEQSLGSHNTGMDDLNCNEGVVGAKNAVDIANPDVSPTPVTLQEAQDVPKATKYPEAEIKDGKIGDDNLVKASADDDEIRGDRGIEGSDGAASLDQSSSEVGGSNGNEDGNVIEEKSSTNSNTIHRTAGDEQGAEANGISEEGGAKDEPVAVAVNNDQNASGSEENNVGNQKEDKNSVNAVEPDSEAGSGMQRVETSVDNEKPEKEDEVESTNTEGIGNGLHLIEASDGSTENNPDHKDDSNMAANSGTEHKAAENGDAQPTEVVDHRTEGLSTGEATCEGGGHDSVDAPTLSVDDLDDDDEDDEFYDSAEDL